MNMNRHLDHYLSTTSSALWTINPTLLGALADALLDTRRKGRAVFTCGNGGSASSANHLAQDLSKGTIVDGAPRLCAISLCDSVSALTAWANDDGYERAFAEQLETLGQSGDLLIAISGSGNSENVLQAVRAAHDLEMHTWGICGFDGGKLIELAHCSIHVPCDDMGMVESVHSVLFHWLVDYIKDSTAGEHDERMTKRLWIMDAECPHPPGLIGFSSMRCQDCSERHPDGGCRLSPLEGKCPGSCAEYPKGCGAPNPTGLFCSQAPPAARCPKVCATYPDGENPGPGTFCSQAPPADVPCRFAKDCTRKRDLDEMLPQGGAGAWCPGVER
jgi:D-sedoheptulose 7-phosphate isomerase